MAAAASSFSPFQWSYDVFLSFRGEDTRNNFTAHLYDALCRKGINTFMDDDELGRGEVISPALLSAIERSMYSIIVLSENYASSGWCLEELVRIVECMKSRGQRVLPIFYNVDPSDVRQQRGKIGEALAKYEGNLENMERVKVWREALTQVANLSGWDSRNKNESMLIKEIIANVSNKLFSMYSSDEKNLVGICSRIEEVESLLCIESSDVRILGIWGMPGIGKTTLANAVYNQVCRQFQSSAFVQNVGEDFKKQGLIGLQQKLLSLLVDDGKLNIRGCTSIRARLCSKKVFIVLDDVKDHAVLEYLTENQDSFGQGSRIIVTTKDKNLLTSHSVNYYEVRKLNDDEAMEVLRRYSPKHKFPRYDPMELSKRIITYAQGLPLALKILGPFLFGMKEHEWKSYLEKLKDTPNPDINQVLRLSYDELDHKVKDIFLDIACFFKEEDIDRVMDILEGCGFFPACGIRTLLDKSFVTISNNKLQMHDLIQYTGMEVVRQKSPNEPGKWSRLWSHEDVSHVLEKNTGRKEVEGIFLDLSNFRDVHFTSEGFKRMNKLRLLKVYKSHICKDFECRFKKEQCEVHFSENFKFHSDDLRYLYWHGYSLKSLPDDFNPENLVELNMPFNHIKQLWKGIKVLEKLQFMELSHSECLMEIPDLSRASNLERLVLEGCTNLSLVHPSLSVLKKLVFLSLRDCINLRDFPKSIELESLQILILSGCRKLKKFPEIKGYMKHLSELFLDGTAIEELPSSIEYATGLVILDLTNCKMLRSLPNSICNLKSLKTLLLSDCSKLESLPQNFGKLKQLRKLYADRIPIRALPTSFADLRNLQVLSFHGCKGPNSPDFLLRPLSTLGSLKDLNLSYCNIMDGSQLSILSFLLSLKKLNLSGNKFASLPSSIIQLPQLTVLKLLNCWRLGALPELPSSIEVINAHNCISLETISNKWDYAWLRHAIFTNCCRMKEYQSTMESSFGTLIANIHQFGSRSRYLQDHGRPLVFRTLIPGSEIPDWFSHQNKGCWINTKICNSNFLGFALCAVLSLKDLIRQEMHYLTCRIRLPGEFSVLPNMTDFIPHQLEDGLIRSDHIWMAYAPAPSCKGWPDSVHIHVSFEMNGSRNTVKSCGFRLVYAEDVRYNNATMIQHISPPQHSSVILEELDPSIPEDRKVGRSLTLGTQCGDCSNKSLELENEDEYHTAEDLSTSGCCLNETQNKKVLITSTTLMKGTKLRMYCKHVETVDEGKRANAEEVDALVMTHTPATEHKKKRAKILK